MFTFLLIIGLLSLFFGISLEKSKEKSKKSIPPSGLEISKSKEFITKEIYETEISSRLKDIETYVYGLSDIEDETIDISTIKDEDKNKSDKETVSNTASINFDKILKKEIKSDKYKDLNIADRKKKVIIDLISEKLSIEEACSILSMEKGEVLLLKNLYRNYTI